MAVSWAVEGDWMAAKDDLSSIHQHPVHVGVQRMSIDSHPPIATILVFITDVHRGMIPALEYALSFGPENVTAVYVDLDSESTEQLRLQWQQWELAIPLVILASPRGSLVRPVLDYIDQIAGRCANGRMIIVLPELVSAKWWYHILHNRPALMLKAALVLRKGKSVATVPYCLKR
jgi:hypothetical protein